MKKIFMFLFGLVLFASCSNDDNPAGPATEAQMQALTGHWYAELPISGETDNWRTEEETHLPERLPDRPQLLGLSLHEGR